MINKKITSEIAIGIIILLVLIMGGIILMSNKKMQASLKENKYVSTAAVNTALEIKAQKNIVFLGDSITALEDWNSLFGVTYVTNAGIPGNTTDDVLSRLNSAVKSKPQKLFLMIGVNDLLRGKDVSYIMTNYVRILSEIRLQSPDTIVYIQSVLPVDNSVSRIGNIEGQKIIELNKQLKFLAEENKAFFVDLYPAFCGSDNKLYRKYSKDGVHLSSVGYAVWKNLITQFIR